MEASLNFVVSSAPSLSVYLRRLQLFHLMRVVGFLADGAVGQGIERL
jgi:hypothetical protein